jgi:hypothetical protein
LGCPQLLSDEFMVLASPDQTGEDPSGNGTAGSAGSGGSDQAAAGSGGSGSLVTLPGPPSVVSVSPSNGASGVAANAVITLTFSEPMDKGAVEGAYGSSTLPPGSVSFSWSQGDTVLQITPNQPLARATGSSPTIAPRVYAFELGTGALDLAGEALPRFSSSFTTLRELTQTLVAIQDRSLTGNYRSDDVYGNNSCEEPDPEFTTCIGDSSNGNSAYRGFITFDLSALPAEAQELSAAQLSMTIHSVRGTPFAALGNLVAEHVSFDSINLDAFNSPALGAAITVGSSAAVDEILSVNLLSPVQEDLPARGRSQFRLRFSTSTDSNNAGDLIETLGPTEKLTLTYLIP